MNTIYMKSGTDLWIFCDVFHIMILCGAFQLKHCKSILQEVQSSVVERQEVRWTWKVVRKIEMVGIFKWVFKCFFHYHYSKDSFSCHSSSSQYLM